MATLDDIYGRYAGLDNTPVVPAQQAYDTGFVPRVDPALGSNMPTTWQQRLGAATKGILGDRDLAYALLANSGPSPQPRSFGQVFGQSAIQAEQAKQARQVAGLSAIYQQAQIAHLLNPPRKPVPVFRDGKIMYEDEDKAIGQQVGITGNQPKPDAAIQDYNLYSQQEQAAGRKPKDFDPWYSDWLAKRPIQPQVVTAAGGTYVVQPSRGGGLAGQTTIASPGSEINFQRGKTGAETDAKAMAERNAEYVKAGVDAADTVPVLRRSIKLLDSVDTGGLDSAKLWATNFLGVTGADEGELSRNMGIAVLQKLRPTFGAQFTKAEGDRLAGIEAGFGKSAAVNKRLLREALQIAEKAAARGSDAADELGDSISKKAIQRSLDFQLGDEKQRSADEIIQEQRRRASGGS